MFSLFPSTQYHKIQEKKIQFILHKQRFYYKGDFLRIFFFDLIEMNIFKLNISDLVYIYTMAIVYSIAKNAIHHNHTTLIRKSHL